MKGTIAIIISLLLFGTGIVHAQNMSTPSDAQVRTYVRKFTDTQAPPELQEKIASARQRAVLVISTQACFRGSNPSALLGRYLMPGREPALTIKGVIFHLIYHDKSTCMSVDRIDNFSSPAKNALSFRAVFVSDSSGESRNLNYTFVRQSDGEWLISNAGR